MRTAYAVETIRAAEAALMAQLPEGALMQRAAAGLAAACGQMLNGVGVYGARITLLVGSGDNGGDALYAGARLARRGAAVTAVLLRPERAHAAGLAALRKAGGRTADDPAKALGEADLVLDGIVGIGGKGSLRDDAAELLRAVTAPIVAVDLPSGIDADTGEVGGDAVTAAATVTFGAYKPGLLIDPGAERVGALRLIDIGLTPHLPEHPDLEALQHADV
ncbi:NAD(P)H-hydrate epimerase, partial [Streptomyces sp. A7024]